MRKIILASTSTIHGSTYLEYLQPTLNNFFKNCNKLIFIPFARPSGISHQEYTIIAKEAFEKMGVHLKSLLDFEDKKKALREADGIFTGGGNTFLLVKQLYQFDLINVLKEVINKGTPYLGTSAGSNIAGLTMKTTNDMPIVYPPSFKTLGLVPFNINPHYLDPEQNSTHKGETRQTRIKEFHKFNTEPVVGLREGSWLEIMENEIILKGDISARIFEYNKKPYELSSDSLLNEIF